MEGSSIYALSGFGEVSFLFEVSREISKLDYPKLCTWLFEDVQDISKKLWVNRYMCIVKNKTDVFILDKWNNFKKSCRVWYLICIYVSRWEKYCWEFGTVSPEKEKGEIIQRQT